MSDPKRPGDVDPLSATAYPGAKPDNLGTASTAFTTPPGARPPGAPSTAYTPPPGAPLQPPPAPAYVPNPYMPGSVPQANPYVPAPPPTPVPPAKRSTLAIIVIAIVVTAGAAGIAFAITKLTASRSAKPVVARGSAIATAGSGSAALGSAAGSAAASPVPDARTPEITAAGADSIATLVAAEHDALFNNHTLDARLIASDAFVFGVDADEAGTGPDAVLKFLAHDLAGMRSAKRKQVWMGDAGTALWMAEQIEVELPQGTRVVSVSQLVDKDHDRYTVRAWHWSRPVKDSIAYAAMKAGTLPEPTQLADSAPTDPDLEDAVHGAFASKAGYVAALSTRADAFAFGSAGETMQGPKIKQVFNAMPAEFSLHDGARVEQVGTELAWAVANVDFKNKFGVETFRVLAVFVHEHGAWKIALAHWSNGFPIPGAP